MVYHYISSSAVQNCISETRDMPFSASQESDSDSLVKLAALENLIKEHSLHSLNVV